jgi:hypothetical protein
MSELERQLVALGPAIEFPPTPDVASAVGVRLRHGSPMGWTFPRRRALAVALAVLAVVVGTAFAVPPARTAILRFLHLRGATVERVETLPAARERKLGTGLGRAMSRAAAEHTVGFRIVLPPLKGAAPRRVYVLADSVASVLLNRSSGRTLLLSEFRATEFGIEKLTGVETAMESVSVDGEHGIWIEGAPHVLVYLDRNGIFQRRAVRISGNVLLWEHGRLTLRLEGRLSKSQALRLARSID